MYVYNKTHFGHEETVHDLITVSQIQLNFLNTDSFRINNLVLVFKVMLDYVTHKYPVCLCDSDATFSTSKRRTSG
jgi:hypothetical protein